MSQLTEDQTKRIDSFNTTVHNLITHWFGKELLFSKRQMLADQMTALVYYHLLYGLPPKQEEEPCLNTPRADERPQSET